MAKPTATDPFETLLENADQIVKTRKSKKQNKPTIELTGNEQAAFNAVCAADDVSKMAEGQFKAKKAAVLPILSRKFLEMCIEQGGRITNPSVQTKEAQGNFVMKNNPWFSLPEKEDGSFIPLEQLFTDTGLFDKEEAKIIAKKEFTQEIEMNFRSINDLRKGDEEEKAVVQKLMKLVVKNFTPEEQKLLLRRETKVTVNDDYIEHAVERADGNYEKLEALVNIVSPQWILSHMKYTGQDLKKTVANLIGGEEKLTSTEVVKTEEFHSPDGKWKSVVNGDFATLYQIKEGGAEVKITAKKCSHADHAKNTCKKWMKDENYRIETLVEAAK